MKTIAEKVKELPKKHQFDSRFQKVPQIIKAKMKKEIKLTPDIDLVLKNDIPYLERTIQPYISEDGTKYIMVRSEEGYKYAESLGNQK